MRLSYPTNIRIIKVPCTGRVAIIHLLKAFEKGADGVFVAGCLEGDCHYQSGNLRAKKRVGYVKKLLESIGVEGDRIAMYNLSAGMGPQFAEIAREMTKKIRELGPFLKKQSPDAASLGVA
jgi:F420-non-reducing hydrogenase iron-sulfur subunit